MPVSEANHGVYDARYTPNGISTSAYSDGPTSRRNVPSHGRGTRYCAARGDVERHVITPKNSTKYRPTTWFAQASPSSTPAPNRHHRTPEPRAPRRLADAALEQRDVHALAHLVAVDDQAAERGDDEQRQEPVEQRGARGDEADPVGDQQQPGDAADERGPADAPRDAHHQQHQDDAAHRAGEPPAPARCSRRSPRRSRSAACRPADAPPGRSRGCPRRRGCAASARPAARSASRRRSGCRHRWASRG